MYSSETFYNIFASNYQSYANDKVDYLNAIDRLIIENQVQANSLIDIGAGDGIRSKQIASELEVTKLTLMDSSQTMIVQSRANVKDAEIICSDIATNNSPLGNYEVVSCLWNVLGHIPTGSLRIKALSNMAHLMDGNSTLYLDINNRYNIAQYGFWNVCKNILKDIILPQSKNGDFLLTMQVDGKEIKTSVHLFTRREIRGLLKSAGLILLAEKFINYKSGAISYSQFGGQIFCIVKKKI